MAEAGQSVGVIEDCKKVRCLYIMGYFRPKYSISVNDRYVTFGNYEYERIGPGHGGYAETFHTFDLKTEEKLTNADIFKRQNLNRVKMALFEVMAKDKKYRASYEDSISPSEVQARIEG